MNVNSSDNTYTNAAYSNKGMSGLASGMDTEGIVKGMLNDIQIKIDKQEQKQQVLEWQQEEYRDVIDKINEFKDKYLSTAGEKSIVMSSSFKTINAESNSSAVKVTTTPEAVSGSFEVQVNSLAEAAKMTSAKVGSSKTVSMSGTSQMSEKTKNTLTLKSGDDEIEIDISGAVSQEDIVEKINSGIAKYNKANGASVSISASLDKDKKIVYSGSGENTDFTVNDESAELKKKAVLQTGAYDSKNTVTLKFDGKSLEVDLAGKDDIAKAINDAITGDESDLKDSGISVKLNDDGNLEFSCEDNEKSFSVSGSASGLASLGIEKGVSSEDGKITAEKASAVAENKLKINGTEISFDADDDLDSIAEKINGENIDGLKVSVSGKTLKFESSADNPDVKIEGSAADLAKFGLNDESKATVTSEMKTEAGEINSIGSVYINYNGVQKGIKITDTDTIDSFQDKLYNAFGSGIKLSENEDGGYSITAGTGKTISVSGSKEALEYIGMDEKGASNHFSTSESIADAFGITDSEKFEFSINGVDFSFGKSATVADMMDQINESRAGVTINYNSLSDQFTMKTNELGADTSISLEDKTGDLMSRLFGNGSGDKVITASGKDASVMIDGEEFEYADNEIKYNGVNLSLKETTNAPVTVESSRDTDKALDTIVSFVEDYNKLIEDLNKRVHDKATYKKYPPLTDAQKDEMSESEIKKWEEKSKTGLLSGDNDIRNFLEDMRKVLYTKVGDNKTLDDIGISSSKNWSDYGKLVLDKDKLTDAINTDMQGVSSVFTGSNGIGKRLEAACKKAANTSSASPGTLVSHAGVKGKTTEKNNEINDALTRIKERITKLKAQYETKKKRYWSQFNSMESMLNNMNSTSSWLSSMLGM